MVKAEAAAALEATLVSVALVALKVLGWALVVAALSLFGWSVSSLHLLAGWTDGELAARLEIVRGVLASVGAGAVAALAGFYYELPIVLICIAVFFAGMSGERYLKPMAEQLLGRLNAAFLGLFGRNGGGGGGPKAS